MEKISWKERKGARKRDDWQRLIVGFGRNVGIGSYVCIIINYSRYSMIFPLLHFPFFSCVSKCDEYQWIPWKFNKFSNSGRSIRIRDDKLQLRCVQFHPNEDWIMVTSTAIVSIWDNWRKNRGKKDWKWHLFDFTCRNSLYLFWKGFP